jgi:hypothetical protein
VLRLNTGAFLGVLGKRLAEALTTRTNRRKD